MLSLFCEGSTCKVNEEAEDGMGLQGPFTGSTPTGCFEADWGPQSLHNGSVPMGSYLTWVALLCVVLWNDIP